MVNNELASSESSMLSQWAEQSVWTPYNIVCVAINSNECIIGLVRFNDIGDYVLILTD